MEKLIDVANHPVADVLDILLQDKSTKKNIIWATDTYEEFDEDFTDRAEMSPKSQRLRSGIILPRIQKSQEAQSERTRKKAEVFTPAWLCNKMNNYCDEDWFGRKNVFNVENDDNTWSTAEGKVEFEKEKDWQRYVDSRRLEITCGEAPYIVSRYDVATGDLIFPPARRVGILDRKMRIVNENTETYEEWLKWTFRAFEACYGYEYQGDNVLIARINLLLSFADYYKERWGKEPAGKLLREAANKIAWNIWQMDGLKDTAPLGKPYAEALQSSLFDLFAADNESEAAPIAAPCKIVNWRSGSYLKFMDLKETWNMGKKLFDYVIGNPPYQEEQVSENADGSLKNYSPPVYHLFMDASQKVADKVELIHPARFLFNAGSTPKDWNKKMLEDEHFKVLHFEIDSSKIFSNTDIKGGIAITYRDTQKNFGMIETFTPFAELNSIMRKVRDSPTFKSIWDIVVSRTAYRLTPKMHEEHPEAESQLSKGHLYDMASNIFNRLPQIFFDKKPNDEYEYIQIIGREGVNRVYKYIRRDYVKDVVNLDKYKVILPQANGSGAIGEVLSTPLIGEPLIGETETFISIGAFDTREEAEACFKYIKSKFSRTMLGVLKVTQNNNRETWKYVPLQDFTENSDIDWSKSVHEIDLQLYRKYNLDEKEIEFIESHVKEMA